MAAFKLWMACGLLSMAVSSVYSAATTCPATEMVSCGNIVMAVSGTTDIPTALSTIANQINNMLKQNNISTATCCMSQSARGCLQAVVQQKAPASADATLKSYDDNQKNSWPAGCTVQSIVPVLDSGSATAGSVAVPATQPPAPATTVVLRTVSSAGFVVPTVMVTFFAVLMAKVM